MRAKREKIKESQLAGFKYFKMLSGLLERLHDAGCQRDRAHNRLLHMDQHVSLLLLSMFNPTCTSLGALQQASELNKVQRILGCPRASLGSLSESARVFDSDLLKEIIEELSGRLPTVSNVPGFDEKKGILTAVDGTLVEAVAKMAWATWRTDRNGIKIHTQFEILKGVLGAMRAIVQLKPKVNVIGLIPSAENMPSGKSYRPGDIITTYSGNTVEIQNTDAEGRMILCDAIAYAQTLGCGTIVDIATLTGACVVALGQKRAGVMGNDAALIERLKKASAMTGERLWHLPCDDEFVEAMKSKVADLKNTGGKWGGACTAAAFLSQFAQGAKWAHVDMAGVGVWGADDKDAPGSIGFGVRLLTAFAMNVK